MPGTNATNLWAVVSSTPGLVRNSGAVSVTWTGTGSDYFKVTFNRDVSGCTWIAGPGASSQTNTPPSAGNAVVYRRAATEHTGAGADLEQHGQQPDRQQWPFHIAVFCPSS